MGKPDRDPHGWRAPTPARSSACRRHRQASSVVGRRTGAADTKGPACDSKYPCFVWKLDTITYHGQTLVGATYWQTGDAAYFAKHMHARGLPTGVWATRHPRASGGLSVNPKPSPSPRCESRYPCFVWKLGTIPYRSTTLTGGTYWQTGDGDSFRRHLAARGVPTGQCSTIC